MSTQPISTANLLSAPPAGQEGFAIAKENLPMQVKDAYELLGITPDASKEEITKAYLDLASSYLDNHKSIDNLLDLSRALDALSNSDKSLTLYSPAQKTSEPKTELKVASLAGKLWEKKLSPVFVLGLALMGGIGVFIGFSFQPKTMVIREIIREASVPRELATSSNKANSPDEAGLQQAERLHDRYAIAVSDIPAKASDKLTTNKAVKAEDTDASDKPILALQKSITEPSCPAGEAERRFAGVMPPSIGSLVYVPPVGKVPPRENIQPLPPVPGIPTPKLMSPVTIRNQVPNTSPMPLQVPQTRRDKPDKNLPVVTAPPSPIPEIIEQIEPLTPKDRTLSVQHRISAVDVLSTIEIPLEGGGTVKANILLEADKKIWKAKKGITRQKLSTLISALVESKDLTLSAQKAGLSLQDIQSLIKPPVQEEKASDSESRHIHS